MTAKKVVALKVHNGLEWAFPFYQRHSEWAMGQAMETIEEDGWRLPTIEELLAIVDYRKAGPACSAIPDMPCQWLWTSTPWAGDPENIRWLVDMEEGRGYPSRDPHAHIIVVRKAQ
jgi:hypothetical protein